MLQPILHEHLLVARRKVRHWLSNFNKVAMHLPMHSNSGL